MIFRGRLEKLKRKMLSIFLCQLLILSSEIIIQQNNEVSADITDGNVHSLLNTTYIKEIADHLSWIIYTSYDQELQDAGLAKGRFFGSKGERDAAIYLSQLMNDTGLIPISNDSGIRFAERITNVTNMTKYLNVNTTQFDVLAKTFTITNNSVGSTIHDKPLDCYISPRTTNDGPGNETPPDPDNLSKWFNWSNIPIYPTPIIFIDKIWGFFDNLSETHLSILCNMTEEEAEANLTESLEHYYNFSFDDIKEHPENATRFPWYNESTQALFGDRTPFFFIRENREFNPHFKKIPLAAPAYKIHGIIEDKVILHIIRKSLSSCIAEILYDYDNGSHACPTGTHSISRIMINGSDGKMITNDTFSFTASLNFHQVWNKSVESYNLIGEIPGADTSRLIIINSLYDSVWSQGTADSSTGVGIVLALARYYKEHNITPKYTTRFVLFGGEETGLVGAKSYRAKHNNDDVEKFIDLNQLGFDQTNPITTLNIGTNSISLKPTLDQFNVSEREGYYSRTNHTILLRTIYRYLGIMSDDFVYSDFGPLHKMDTVTFLKDTGWYLHHRDGMNHTQGDTMNHYNDADVAATADIVFNVTKYFCLNPDCSFTSIDSPWLKDSNDYNDIPDSIQINYTINTSLPNDRILAKAMLICQEHPILGRFSAEKYYTVTPTGKTGSITVELPSRAPEGHYTLHVFLFNSTGIIDDAFWRPFYYLDPGRYANDTNDTGPFLMSAPNDPPETPYTPTGNISVNTDETHPYTTHTTDPNLDHIWYQWKYQTEWFGVPITYYTRWITGGPHDSGENCTRNISWQYPGAYNVWARAKDVYLNPNIMSNWSDGLTVNVSQGSGGNPEWNNEILDDFTLTTVAVGQQTSCDGLTQNIADGPQPAPILNWTWDYGDGNITYDENASHHYNQVGNYTIHLSINDGIHYFNCSQNITVLILNAGFHAGGNWKPGKQIVLNDTSAGFNPIVNWTWNFGDGNTSYTQNTSHNYTTPGVHNITLTIHDSEGNNHQCTNPVYVELNPPELAQVITTPNPILSGYPVTIAADLLDNQSGVKTVKANITYPDNTSINLTLFNDSESEYDDTLLFNDTWHAGQYNISIWTVDNANNTNSTPGFTFTVLPTPLIDYDTPPTPQNNTIQNHRWAQINATTQDATDTSAFIDWDRSLHGYWPMDEYNTTCITDNSTYDNNGVFQNGLGPADIVPGRFGKALDFDGTDDAVNLGNNSSLNLGTGDFTVLLWEKSHQTNYSGDAVILGNQPEINGTGYYAGIHDDKAKLSTQQGGLITNVTGATNITDNAWHHLVYIRHGSQLTLYVDAQYDQGTTGTIRNITNKQDTCLSQTQAAAHFDGLLDEAQLYTRALSWEEINASYNSNAHKLSHNFTDLADGTCTYSASVVDMTGNHSSTETRYLTIDTDGPVITEVSANTAVGFGATVTIQATITDNISGLHNATAQIHYPSPWQGTQITNLTMTLSNASAARYQCAFNTTWLTGRYNVSIIATDNVSNVRTSTGSYFDVAAHATIHAVTIKDSYGANEYVNLTDPPSPPENYTLTGRGPTWNTYYDDTTGNDILEASSGPINYQNQTGDWTPINTTLTPLQASHPAYAYGYRIGNDQGLYATYLKPNLGSDWPFAFAYNRSNNPNIHTLRTKLIGVGYLDPANGWSSHILQNTQDSQAQLDGNHVTYPEAFTGTDLTLSYATQELKETLVLSNTTKAMLQSHPPSQYGLHDDSSYLVFITKIQSSGLNLFNETQEINEDVTLSDGGISLRTAIGDLRCVLPLGEAYELNNDSVRVRLICRVVHYQGNIYLLAGLRLADLNAMTYPVVIDPTTTLYSSTNDGYIYYSNSNYNSAWTKDAGTVSSSATSIYIGQKKVSGVPGSSTIYRGFLFFNTTEIPANTVIDSATLGLYKVSDYSTTDFQITVQNGQPTYPSSPLQQSDYDKSHYSGNGGTFDTSGFTSGYNNLTLNSDGRSWITRAGWTKLCLRSSRDISGTTPTGSEYVTVTSNEYGSGCQPRLIVVYRNQSKIKNTGTTDIQGYLLIQMQYDSGSGNWVVENKTVDETTPRTIVHGQQLGLDTVFNGLVNTHFFTHGNGEYRVYAAFRDPEGNILVDSDQNQLVSIWQFSVSGL